MKTTHQNHIAALTVCATIALAYGETWLSLTTLWAKMDYSYSYGFLALALGFWHVYKNRETLFTPVSNTNVLGLLMLGCLSITWMMLDFLKIQVMTQLMMPAILFSVAFASFGFATAVRLTPAYLYLLFSVPVWDYLNPLLQSTTALVASSVLSLTNLAVYIDGNFISIPYGTFEVAGGCSGLRYFMCALVLVLFYSQQNKENSLSTCIKLFGVAILFALFANWLRVILIILIGYYSEMQSSIVEDHDVFGWYVFIGTFTPAFFILNWIEKRGAPKQVTPPPLNKKIGKSPLAWTITATLSCIVLGPLAKELHAKNAADINTSYQLNPAIPLLGWDIKRTSGDWRPVFLGARYADSLSFTNDAHTITINMLYFQNELQGRELVNNNNRIADDKVWRIESAPQGINEPSKFSIRTQVISQGRHQKKLVFSYYKIGDYIYSNMLKTKLSQLQALIDPSVFQGFLAFSIDCRAECIKESQALALFQEAYETAGSIIPSAAPDEIRP